MSTYSAMLYKVQKLYYKQKRLVVAGLLIILLIIPITIFLATSQSIVTSKASIGFKEPQVPADLNRWLWMVDQKSAIDTMQALNPNFISTFFQRHTTYVLQNPDQVPVYPGIPVARYRSFQAFTHDIANNNINRSVHWVLYDNEKWTFTPITEQQNPLYYEKAFAQLAHKHGYKVILAPAQDLVSGFVSHSLAWQQYLSLGLAKVSAKYGDIYEIQAQPYEEPPYNTTDNFQRFISSAVAQAQAVNPHIVILAGVSTHRVTSSQQLATDMQKVKPYVSGFWFNVPSKTGPSDEDPAQLGIDALKIIETSIPIVTNVPFPSPTVSVIPKSTYRFSWIISDNALHLIEQADPNGFFLEQEFFNNSHTYLIGNDSNVQKSFINALPTITFTSYAAMYNAFSNNQIDKKYKAVIYDNEAWKFTPINEQLNAGYYYALAAKLVHSHDLIFIAAPATDLVNVIDKSNKGSKYDDFIRLGLAGAAAKFADIYEIQAQGSEADVSLYTSFVVQAVQQAKSSNPRVKVLAGLSTNPSGQNVSGTQLFNAITGTQSIVTGYWLNIPSGGSYCPLCGTAKPQGAIDLLQLLKTYSVG